MGTITNLLISLLMGILGHQLEEPKTAQQEIPQYHTEVFQQLKLQQEVLDV